MSLIPISYTFHIRNLHMSISVRIREKEVQIVSYGINYQTVPGADIYVDLRDLCTPGYDRRASEHLGNRPPKRPSGLVPETRMAIEGNMEAQRIMQAVLDHIEGFSAKQHPKPVWVAVNCSWGKHRSVAFVEMLRFALEHRYRVSVTHMEQYRWDKKHDWRQDWWPKDSYFRAVGLKDPFRKAFGLF